MAATMEPLHRSARLIVKAGTRLNRVGRRGKYLGSHRFTVSVSNAHTIRDRQTGRRIIVVPNGPEKGLYEFA